MALRTPLSVTPHLYMGDSTGRPLDNGVVYFGEQDKDPEYYPITLYSDDALTLPLAQPVHTKGGYLYDKGDMVEPHAKELIYSVKVLDSYGRKVFYKGAMMRNSWNDDVIEQINAAIVASTDIARQIATDITNEAINNTAIEGGVLADTFVTMTAVDPTGVARNLRSVNRERVSVKDFGAVGDSVTPDDVSIQKNITWVEENSVPYVYFPTTTEDYLVNSPLIFTVQGVRIFGDKGATYNAKKKGNLVVGASADYAIDLGNFQPPGVVGLLSADAFSVENIGIIPAPDTGIKTKDGIWYTSKNEGPNRGGVIRAVSMTGMNKAIYLPYPEKSVGYATLVIENCCLSRNNYAVVAEGNIFGFRFVGNQAEQNSMGALHGTFNGPVYIADNMLEGQKNCINITVPPITGGRSKISIERNYFEKNSGDYVVQYASSSSDGTIIMRNNYMYNLVGGTDYLRIASTSNITIINEDPHPVTFMGKAYVLPESNIINNAIRYYNVRELDANNNSAIVTIKDYTNLVGNNVDAVRSAPIIGTKVDTPHGLTYALQGNDFLELNNEVVAGELVTISFLMRADKPIPDMSLMAYESTKARVIGEQGYAISQRTVGKWLLHSWTFKARESTSKIFFRLYSPTSNLNTARNTIAVSSATHGEIPLGGVVSVYPNCPSLDFTMKGSAVYNTGPIGAGETKNTTLLVRGATIGDSAVTGSSAPLNGLQVSTQITEKHVARVYFYNPTTSPITLAATTLTTVVF